MKLVDQGNAMGGSAANHLASEKVLVFNFGSQYAQLIARRVREQNVYCEIVSNKLSAAEVAAKKPKGIILSGGPASVYAKDAPQCDPGIFHLGIPVLGICYGMQLACQSLGGEVVNCRTREFGSSRFEGGRSSRSLAGRLASGAGCVDEPW